MTEPGTCADEGTGDENDGQERQEEQEEEEQARPPRVDAGFGIPPTQVGRPEPAEKMKRKEYERELRKLHGELVAMQEWVKATGAKVCIVFEGRDTAGKGGTIKAITERVSPRVFRVVALPAPTEREKSQMYLQRYVPHFPAGGEVVIFDRSWYNRPASNGSWASAPTRGAEVPRRRPRLREGDDRFGDDPREVLARGQPRRADPATSEPDR